jgi:LmbE family N-acetylglucosaminyl deacetylase
MPFELLNPSDRVALFLFAHQDDEFAVFQAIHDEVCSGARVFCAYLTSGVHEHVAPSRRNIESISVLNHIGVPKLNILFPGLHLGIADSMLLDNLSIAAEWIIDWVIAEDNVNTIYIPAWEGGHKDHDALHALAVSLTSSALRNVNMRQFPMYNAQNRRSPFFNVLHPLADNGIIESRKISLTMRLRFLRYCSSYPSQFKSWIGLLPWVTLHYVLYGTQITQPVSLLRILERPHQGPLYYERRGSCTWERMNFFIQQWRQLL